MIFIKSKVDLRITKKLHTSKFSRVLSVEWTSGKSFTYKPYKPFELYESKTTANLHNIERYPIRVGFMEEYTRSISYWNPETSKVEYGGYFTSILRGFTDYINGSFELQHSSENHIELMNLLEKGDADFITNYFSIVDFETLSAIISLSEFTTIVPYPSEIV